MVTILSVQVRQQTCHLTPYPGHDKIRSYRLTTTERAASREVVTLPDFWIWVALPGH